MAVKITVKVDYLNNMSKNLTEKQAEKYGGKFIVDITVDAYVNRGMERVDNEAIIKFI